MTYRFGDMTLDRRSGRLERAGRAIPLEPRAFDVLWALLERAGELVDHQTLIDLVWVDVAVTPHSLTEAISQLRRALNDDPRQPRLIETAHRRGYRFIAEIERVPSPPAAPRWRPPERLVDLVGRAWDLADLADRFTSSRLLTLVGPGGVGKTQLALEAARQAAPRFADGAAVIDLGPAIDAVDVQRLVADVIGAPERQGPEPGAAIASVLRDATVLIVLDNCERVSDAAGRLAAAVLGGARGVQVLATSQRPLDAPGEALVRVAPLGCVAAHAGAGPPDAVRLFAQRAAAVQPGFDAATHAAVVSEICQRLDGLPLAIELAAAQVRVLSPDQILDRLDSRFELLVRAGPADAARHRTLRATIEWSTSLLARDDERFLEDLSVFPGGWDLDAAATVAAEGAGPALARLTTLVDRSLVLADTTGPSARYRLLDSVRFFAHGRLVQAGRDADARHRLLRHYSAIAARADREWYSPQGDAWRGRLQDDVSNLRAALQWSLEAPGAGALGLQLAADLRWFWRAAGLFFEGCSWIERLLAAAVDAASLLRARGEIAYALLAHHKSAFAAAREALARGLARMTDAVPEDLAAALSIVALNEALSGGADECTAAAMRALDIANRLDLAWVAASAGLALGQRDAMRAEHAQAARAMTAAHAQSLRSGEVFLESYVATNLALQRFLVGDRAGSRALFVRALSLSRRLNNLRAIAGCFEGLAYLSAEAGDGRGAARLIGAAARLRTITAAPLLPQWTRAHDQCRDRIAEAIGPEEAADQEIAGAQLPVDALAAEIGAG